MLEINGRDKRSLGPNVHGHEFGSGLSHVSVCIKEAYFLFFKVSQILQTLYFKQPEWPA